MKGLFGAALLVVLSTSALAVHAQDFDFRRDCAKWIEQHGYSTDYIKLKVGKRQPGVAESWRGNVEIKDLQPGDVIITPIRQKSRGMRAAHVEEVQRNADGRAAAVIVSEWNVGPYIDERCNVTDHFGRLSQRVPIPIGVIVKVWRPSLPL